MITHVILSVEQRTTQSLVDYIHRHVILATVSAATYHGKLAGLQNISHIKDCILTVWMHLCLCKLWMAYLVATCFKSMVCGKPETAKSSLPCRLR